MEKTAITVAITVNVSVDQAWQLWTLPEHIINWNQASDDWHTTKAENDVRVGGKFNSRMEAKDGSFGFDFEGVYEEVQLHKKMVYALGDGRKVTVEFDGNEKETTIIETFDAEQTHSLEMQQTGWQAILDNFKKYAETIS